MTRPVTVVLVDDHLLFRQGMRELLALGGEIDVVAEGSDGADAVRLAVQFRPDVILLDVEMPGWPAGRTLDELRRAAPGSKVVVLTMHEDAALVHELLGRGASAYLVKSVARATLVAAICATALSETDTVTLTVPRDTVRHMDNPVETESPLSAREEEVLALLAQAKSNAQIATQLFITQGTVKRHLTNVYAKLGAVSRIDAVRKATAVGLLNGMDLEPGDELQDRAGG